MNVTSSGHDACHKSLTMPMATVAASKNTLLIVLLLAFRISFFSGTVVSLTFSVSSSDSPRRCSTYRRCCRRRPFSALPIACVAASPGNEDGNEKAEPAGSDGNLESSNEDAALLSPPQPVGNVENADSTSTSSIRTSTVRIDDGGSDLTDRFKYKVNALMGVFDPADAESDTERQSGNILNALLTFPSDYTFHVVGKTNGDASLQDAFVQEVEDLVRAVTGEENFSSTVTPRGSKYTKVTIQVAVSSSDMVSSMYERLEQLELSVMQF